MEAKFKRLHPNAKLPVHGRPGDAGLDLFSVEALVIPPRDRRQVALGFAMEIPLGYVAHVWDRSGMAAKMGIHSMAGVIDSTYRGEVKVILYNTTDQPYEIAVGDKVAQMVIQQHETVTFTEVDALSDTERGEQGWLSSGK
ncbi:MAG: dUTP diphosphatase [Patescibacteria group bacterium]